MAEHLVDGACARAHEQHAAVYGLDDLVLDDGLGKAARVLKVDHGIVGCLQLGLQLGVVDGRHGLAHGLFLLHARCHQGRKRADEAGERQLVHGPAGARVAFEHLGHAVAPAFVARADGHV